MVLSTLVICNAFYGTAQPAGAVAKLPLSLTKSLTVSQTLTLTLTIRPTLLQTVTLSLNRYFKLPGGELLQ